MITNPVAFQTYSRSFPVDTKRSEKASSYNVADERDREKSKPEEDEKRPGDIAVA